MQNILKKLEILFQKANNIEALNLTVKILEELSDSKYTNIVDWNYINDLYNVNIKKIPNWCSKIKKIIESNMKKENQKENDSIQSTLNTILESINQINGTVNDLKLTVYNMDQRLVKVENDVGKTSETVDELKFKVDKTNETVDELKSTVHKMDQRLVKVENDVGKTNETVDELKSTVHKMDQRLVKVEERMTSLEKKVDTGFGNLKKHFEIDFLK